MSETDSWREWLSSPAAELQDGLKEFAEVNPSGREARLRGLLKLVQKNTTKDVVNELTDPTMNHALKGRDARLYVAKRGILPAVRTRISVDDKPRSIWKDSYSVVALSRAGQILFGEEKDSDQLPTALSAAIFELHLSLKGNNKGAYNPGNLAYFLRRGFKDGKDLIRGAATAQSGMVIGASDCTLKDEYVNSLLPSSMQGQKSPDFLAGYTNECFARRAADSLTDPQPLSVQVEPELYAELRRAH